MSAVLERDRKRQRKAKRLRGIEPLERRDVVGEWLVGLAGVGLAATAEAQRWDSEPIAEGSSATVELGTSVDRGLACIVSDSPRSRITAPDFQVSQLTNPQAANDTASDGTLPAQRGFTTADVSAFEQWDTLSFSGPGGLPSSQGSDAGISPPIFAPPAADLGATPNAAPGFARAAGSAGNPAAGSGGSGTRAADSGRHAQAAATELTTTQLATRAQPLATQPTATTSATVSQGSTFHAVEGEPFSGIFASSLAPRRQRRVVPGHGQLGRRRQFKRYGNPRWQCQRP